MSEPLPNVEFVDQGLAYAMKKNRAWNRDFSWESDRSTAWVAVRADALGPIALAQSDW